MESRANNRRILTSARWGGHAGDAGDAGDANETLGMMLRRLRVAAGLTQEELAERSGASVYSISNIERDVPHRPRHDTLRILAQALQLAPQDAASLVAQAERVRSHSRSARVAQLPIAAAQDSDVFSSLSRSPLIGRERDIQAIEAQWQHAETHLLSLVGPAGVGKTRLAAEIVRQCRERATFDDGCFALDLVPLHDAQSILAALAHAVGLAEATHNTTMQSLKAYWREKETFVLLDNFEHVLPVATQFAELLASCPGLRLLITSRRRLNIRGEQVYSVQPLALPALAPAPAIDALRSVPAVALFVGHAQAIQRDFELTDENGAVIAQICRRLDGLPLALELAAARMAMFSPQEMLTRLESQDAQDSPLRMLAGGPQDAPERQQTLRAALEWSYHLLNAGERRLFQTLAVFQSYPTSEAALAIHVAANETAGVASSAAPAAEATHDALLSLVESSLVNTRRQLGSAMRLGLFETVREYARELAAQDGYLQRAQAAHARYYMAQAETAAARMQTTEESAWLRRLDLDLPELRAALAWACKEDVTLGVRLAIALRAFWVVRGYVREGLEWFTALLAPASPSGLVTAIQYEATLPQTLKAQALVAIALLLYRQAAYHDALVLLHTGLDLHIASGDDVGAALALNTIGAIALRQGDLVAAKDALDASFAHADAAGDLRGKGLAMLNLAATTLSQRCNDEAQQLYEQGLVYQREAGDLRQVAYSLQGLANIAYARKDITKAQAIYQECLEIQRHLGVAHGVAYCLNALGQLAHVQGDEKQAPVWLKEAYQAYYQLGDDHGIATALSNQGDVLRAEGHHLKAFSLYQESLRIFHKNDERAVFIEVLLEVASVHPDPVIAAQLLGATQAACDAIEGTLSDEEAAAFHHRSQAAQAAIGAAVFERLFTAGRRLTLDAAVELAIQPPTTPSVRS